MYWRCVASNCGIVVEKLALATPNNCQKKNARWEDSRKRGDVLPPDVVPTKGVHMRIDSSKIRAGKIILLAASSTPILISATQLFAEPITTTWTGQQGNVWERPLSWNQGAPNSGSVALITESN